MIERALTQHFGLLKFMAIGTVVFFAGSAFTTHLASKILLDVGEISADADTDSEADEPDPTQEGEPKSKRPSANDRGLAAMATKGTRKQLSAEGIVDHNIFCPSCAPIEEAPLLASAGGAPLAREVHSQLPLQLLATMESDDPSWSMATIRDLDHDTLGAYTANEQLRPGVTILAVERGRVVLLNQGRREFILDGAAPPPPPKAVAKAKPKPKSKSGKSVAIEGASEAIDCASENSCTIQRAFVEKLMADPRQLMSQARMFPVSKDGETAGFRVSGVRKGSLATIIGLKNGDVVSEINGSKLATIDDALAMYQKLRRASHLSVTVERGGAVITKELSIK